MGRRKWRAGQKEAISPRELRSSEANREEEGGRGGGSGMRGSRAKEEARIVEGEAKIGLKDRGC